MSINSVSSTGTTNKTGGLAEIAERQKELAEKKRKLEDASMVASHLIKNEKYLNGNVDGKLDKNELQTFTSKLDTDKDGKISDEEIQNWINSNEKAGNENFSEFFKTDTVRNFLDWAKEAFAPKTPE